MRPAASDHQLRIVLGLLVFCSILSACHRPPPEDGPWLVPAPADGWSLATVDNTAEHRFDLILKNESDRSIYLYHDEWPNSLGRMHFAGDTVSIETEGERHLMVQRNMGLCVASGLGCFIEIRPGEVLDGFLAYGEFLDIPPDAYTCPKELSFGVEPLVEELGAEHLDVIEVFVEDAARRWTSSTVCVRALDSDELSSFLARRRDGWEACGEFSRDMRYYVAVKELERSGRSMTGILVTYDGVGGAEYRYTARWGRDVWSIRDRELLKIE